MRRLELSWLRIVSVCYLCDDYDNDKLVNGSSYAFKKSPGMKSFTAMHNIFTGLSAGFEATFIVINSKSIFFEQILIGSNQRLEICIWIKISIELVNIRISLSSIEEEGNHKFRIFI